jgi:hypothetical protein
MSALDGKRFRVVRNDGPGAEVDVGTAFAFTQQGDMVVAEYAGGGVRMGRLVGRIVDGRLLHGYVQVGTSGELGTGRGDMEIRVLADGRIQLVDSWAWEDRSGRGLCILEEAQP